MYTIGSMKNLRITRLTYNEVRSVSPDNRDISGLQCIMLMRFLGIELQIFYEVSDFPIAIHST